jgi:transcriptional regulator GlxA family with amidase domain
MAYSANMCTRNFERHFLDEVGMSPKRFSCVVRFNHAFQLKLRYPQKDWTSIAPECGYFDQTHLIKDFKRYSGNCPSAFLKQTPLTEQQYIGGTID